MSSQNLTIFYICKKMSLNLSTAVWKDRVWPEGGAAYATGGVCGTAWELAREQLRCSTRRPSWSRTSPGSLAKARAQASPPGRGLGLQVARQRRPQSKGRTATQRNLRVRTVSEDKRAWSEVRNLSDFGEEEVIRLRVHFNTIAHSVAPVDVYSHNTKRYRS